MLIATPPAGATRLAVWGDPIDHSLSPLLHAAAYRELGWSWEYARRRVDEGGFVDALSGLDASWRGLSLTMPLKERAFEASVRCDRDARLTRAVNTLLLTSAGPVGVNTDVGGLATALEEAGYAGASAARVLGAGRTAASAVLALARVGVGVIEVVARRPEAAAALTALGDEVGVTVRSAGLDVAPRGELVDVTVSTLPGGTVLDAAVVEHAASSPLFDVAYNPWPSRLAAQWRAAGGEAVSGAGMLLHQAVRQIRFFVGGDPDVPLEREDAVIAAMRAAVASA